MCRGVHSFCARQFLMDVQAVSAKKESYQRNTYNKNILNAFKKKLAKYLAAKLTPQEKKSNHKSPIKDGLYQYKTIWRLF